MTIPQSVMGILCAVVSVKANAEERGSWKVRLLAEPARPYGQLEYGCQCQMKLHGRHREGA